jgi:thiamine kinase-like enzyme
MPITIDEALSHIPLWKHARSVTVSPLAGGVTNRSYRVDVDGEAYVVRICAADAALLGVDRSREYRCAADAGLAGVAPEVVCALPESGVIVTRFVQGGHPVPDGTPGPDVVERVVQSIQRCHAGPAFEGAFSPFRTLEAYLDTARRLGAPLPEDIAELYRSLPAIERAMGPNRASGHPCHNDLWGPNLIDDGRRVWIVDWEYAGTGDIYFDLANFAVYHSPSDATDETLLRTYFDRVSDAAFARLKLLKIVAELREAMWYVVAQWLETARPDFAPHAATHFARCRDAACDPRLGSWLKQIRNA